MGDRYVLSVWENHGDANKWLLDICDERSYLRNSFFYLKRYKKPYYYTPLYIGTHAECEKKILELRRKENEDEASVALG